MARREISDEVWGFLEPMLPAVKTAGRHWTNHRSAVESVVWKYRTGALRAEPPDHAIGRSRGGLTCKVHLVADGKGRPLSWVLTGGNVNDTIMMTAVLEGIHVRRVGTGRPRTRPDRVLADKGYPSKANRAWLRQRGIAATIPERDDQIGHRRTRPGRPIDFGDRQRVRYRGRNVVERCFFNKLGMAMRTDKLARNYRAAIALAATLIWLRTISVRRRSEQVVLRLFDEAAPPRVRPGRGAVEGV